MERVQQWLKGNGLECPLQDEYFSGDIAEPTTEIRHWCSGSRGLMGPFRQLLTALNKPDFWLETTLQAGSPSLPYAYASCVTNGVTSKFSVGGGDVVVHSSPLAPQGLGPAIGP